MKFRNKKFIIYRQLNPDFAFYYCNLRFTVSESFTFTNKPSNPIIVVEGVNSSRVSLDWDFSVSDSTYNVMIYTQRPGELVPIQIVGRTQTNAFGFANDKYRADYEAKLPATLVLKDVTRNKDQYAYVVVIASGGIDRANDRVIVDVVGKWQCLMGAFSCLACQVVT